MANRTRPSLASGLLASLLLVVAANFAEAQDTTLRAQLFAEADRAMTVANDAHASILAPASYEQAAEHYRNAESGLARGRNLDTIRRELAAAVDSFTQAAEATELARVSLGEAIAARDDAEMAEAARFASAQWREAEVEFADAARRLEGGNLNRAQRTAEEARQKFRAAELMAIEANYLSGA